MNTHKCEQCGKQLREGQDRFCSRKCLYESMKVELERKCQNCGKVFQTTPWRTKQGQGKYCCRECFYEGNKGHPGYNKVDPIIVECIWCGKTFETRGRGRTKVGTKYCSRECQAYARVNKHKVKQMSAVEAAYLAGLIDGEGSITAVDRKTKGRMTYRLSVSNTFMPILEWCVKATAVGTIVVKKSTNPKHKDSAWWQCYSWNAYDILRQTLPYMLLKDEKARSMMAELDAIKRIAGKDES